MKLNNKKTGFTFIEVLLVIAALGILAGLAIPFYQSFQVSSQLDNTVQELVQTLRRAQAKAMASENYQSYGILFEPHKFILFGGTSYNPNDPFNEEVELSNVLTVDYSGLGGNSVIFSRIRGLPDHLGSITVSTSAESQTISINYFGAVNVL